MEQNLWHSDSVGRILECLVNHGSASYQENSLGGEVEEEKFEKNQEVKRGHG